LIFFLKPLTLTLSPLAGRGDWKEFSLVIFYFSLKIFKFYIPSFFNKKLSSLSPLPACGERVRVRGLNIL
jgi:hypothetical protein